MRLATFNVLHGRSLQDGRVSTDRLAQACASLDADVLALQEVDRGQARSGGADQTAAVAAAMGAAAWRFEPALIGEPGGRWRAPEDGADGAGEPGYGVAIVSRLPVRRWRALRLGAARIRSPVYVPAARRFILLPDEPRLALVADVDGLAVASVHLSFVPVYNLVQLRRATRQLGEGPCVLLGDLNVPGRLPALVTGWRPLARATTFPADRPSWQIDHALAHGPVPAPLRIETRRLPLSDHRALIVDLPGLASRGDGIESS